MQAKHAILTLAVLITISAFAVTASANAILFDFGSTAYTGTDSPGHEDGLATGSTWNSLAVDTVSGIVDEFGNAVAGVSVDLGQTTTDTGFIVNYAAATKVASYAGSATYSLFNSDLGTDHVVRDGSGLRGVAIVVKGLAYGDYDFYLTGFRGDVTQNVAHDYYVRYATGSSDVTDFTNAPQLDLPNTTLTQPDWIDGDNYVTASFIIDANNPNLYLLQNSDTFIGVVNSLEIVPVPEPATMTLALGGLALMLRRRA